MKKSKKKRWLLALIPLLLIPIGLLVIQHVTAGEESKVILQGQQFDQLNLADGQLEGAFKQSAVSAKVKLTIENNHVKGIDLLEHTNGLGSKSETIIKTVIEQQGTDVDSVSGATLSSKVILKAIENAIKQ
ncbi:FMN-binding protein [Vagococcus sp. BWB3-3]|uniref:FMN-binding protein n=1 Tax=Vagococcus allomyrinae TaxID=2794353 RepID=A0A940PA45_9ENTE|nr:FMN-binding protein [Vagococcus allomyrinae]MBP1040945.1 FMN-binding protein [Vagococcus allomyrinae]